jgi:signal transduction histidine kinase
MASIGQLAAGVAHEINNPTGFVNSNIKTLSGYVEDLLGLLDGYRQLFRDIREMNIENVPMATKISEQMTAISHTENEIDIEYLRSDLPELIEESREGMDRIRKIVMDLKDFAHPEDNQKISDINECIESTLNIVWNEIKYKAKLEKHYEDIPPVMCYPRQLNQVIMNLLVNAAQAIDDQGVIKIKTEAIDGNARIIIGDTGKGIPKEHISKIFDPFFTTKPVGKGTGLGLNLVYNIIKKHGGTVSVESELGKGTTFTVDIPLKTEAEKTTAYTKESEHE